LRHMLSRMFVKGRRVGTSERNRCSYGRYGGIHFVQGDLRGRSGGRLVGAQVWAKALTYFNGTATP
jgi:hypothetical protein